MIIDKSTTETTKRLLNRALPYEEDSWVLDFDSDKALVYYETWGNKSGYTAYQRSYSISEDHVVTFGDDEQPVVNTSEYEVVGATDESTEKSVENTIIKTLTSLFKPKKRDIQVVKQFGVEDEPMYAIEPLYIAPGEVDGQGDTMDLEGITSMVESLNKANDEGRLQSGLFHKHKTDCWSLEKAWVNPVECMIGVELVPEGQPIAKTLFHSVAAYQLRVNGDIAGLSIGAKAKATVDLTKSAEELEALKSTPEAKRLLQGVHFDWDHPELTYTSPSQGGAASMKNEAYTLNKAKKATVGDLHKSELAMLAEIGEEFVSLEKHLGVDNNQTPSSSAEAKVGEETKNVDKGNKETMSENTELFDKVEALQKALAVSEAERALVGYGFEADLSKSLAESIASLESTEVITKALDVLVARTEVEVAKAKEAAPVAETDLQKTLATEAGESGEPEKEVAKSFLDEIAAHQAARIGAK